MKIRNLNLVNFRNYSKLNVNFHPELNVIIGNNGQGKTNLLESIYLLSTTRSFRLTKDYYLIKENSKYAVIEATIKTAINNNLKIVIYDKGKSLFVANNQINKNSEFIGILNAVLFSPGDIEIFNNSPASRRKFLNVEIGKLSKNYMGNLNNYHKLLKDRNILLKANTIDEVLIATLNQQMVFEQIEIIKQRKLLLDFINEKINKYYNFLANSKDIIKIVYSSCIKDYNNIKLELEKMYLNNFPKDKLYHFTLNGIHKDDLIFYFNNQILNNYASQGQKRMVLLAYKFALAEFIKKMTNETPILLLDDVLSELDTKVRERLFKLMNKDMQVFITTTDLNNLNIKKQFNLFQIDNGILERLNYDR